MSKNLGNVMGVVKGITPPMEADGVTEKRYVLWAKQITATPPKYDLYYFDNTQNNWKALVEVSEQDLLALKYFVFGTLNTVEIESNLNSIGYSNLYDAILFAISAIPAKADLIDGKVPTEQLPSYVDDILEFSTLVDFPTIGEQGKIYVAVDTNFSYRWSGSSYVAINIPISTATPNTDGVSKLYNELGSNTDGSINQQVVSEALVEIESRVNDISIPTEATITEIHNESTTNSSTFISPRRLWNWFINKILPRNNTWTGNNIFAKNTIVKGESESNGNALEVQNLAGTKMVTFANNGNIGVNQPTPLTGIDVNKNPFFRIGLSFSLSTTPATLNNGDLYVDRGGVFLNSFGSGNGASGSFGAGTTTLYKRSLTGLGIDCFAGINIAQNFSTDPFSYGLSSLIYSGYRYGNVLTAAGSTNVHADMHEGMLFSVKGDYGQTQFYSDIKGQIYARGLGVYAESIWKKYVFQGVSSLGVGTRTPAGALDVVSITQGSLPFPRMTLSQKTAIIAPAVGTHVYQTDGTEGVYVYKSTGWQFAY